MTKLTLKEVAIPMIKAIDSFNYLLKSHHRRTAVISYHIGKALDLSNDDLLHLVIAASLHDIGALSVQERDMLVQEDVLNPQPHCVMGYHMLKSFELFKDIAQIIKHHHIKYEDSLSAPEGEIPFQSFIIHLADRVDVLISPDENIFAQKESVTKKIEEKVGTVFRKDVFEAFLKASKSHLFWVDINNLTISQLFKKMEFTLDCELTFDHVLEFALALSKIVDFRSRFTACHSYTVAQLATAIGEIFELNDTECKKLKIAGYLHDIGKIGIDPRLLEKPGKLTDEEFQEIKLHPYYTGQILDDLHSSEWFKDIVFWSEHHHEKNDGSGYPHSLRDKDLDMGVKILAFADIITALMENRPYREGLSVDVAFQIIREELAPSISSEMFEKIEKHAPQIDTLVSECKSYSSEEYKKGTIQQ